jgi:glucosamine 6-phosphate synthetase-like amidotransferase/phosphosugar isomerase protein
LIAAAERLTYRGYDSVGAATLNSGKIDLRKDVGKVDAVATKYNIAEMRGQRGITQLRWATFGEPSQVNSQPHLDSNGDMVGAHNGNVVNNVELRLEFMAEGMTVRSQNDGETCVHAVERYIKRGYEFIDAIRLAYGDLEGDYAFVIGRANDDKLYAFKKGSGMVIGIGDGFTCLSSDLPSILPLTRNVIRPQDGEKNNRPNARNSYRVDGCGAEGRVSAFYVEGNPRAGTSRPRVDPLIGWQPRCAAVGREDEKRASSVFDRMRYELSRGGGGVGVHRATGGADRHPRACAAVHRAIRARGWV